MTNNTHSKNYFRKKIKELHSFIYSDFLAFDKKNKGALGIVRFIVTIIRVFIYNHCLRQGAALAFATLLGIFPLVAVLFFLVPVFINESEDQQKAQQMMMSILIPGSYDKHKNLFDKINFMPIKKSDESEELKTQTLKKDSSTSPSLSNSEEQIESDLKNYFKLYSKEVTKLKAIGIIGTIIISIILFITVEQSFALIWGVRKRPLIRSIVIFSGVIIWIPLLMGLSIYFSAEIHLVPSFFLTFAAFVFGYFFIPNTKVSLRWAMAGALVSAMLWEVAKMIFNMIVFSLMSYSNLFNAVGSIPYLLIWLYVSWLIILLGVVISYCGQNLKNLLYEDISKTFKLTNPSLILMILFILADRLDKGLKGATIDTIKEFCPVPDEELNNHINFLAESNLISMLADEDIYILVKSADKIFLKDILSFSSSISTIFRYEKDIRQKLIVSVEKIDTTLSDILKNKSIKEMIK